MSVANSQSSIETDSEAGSQSRNRFETAQYFTNKTASLNIVKTTIQPDGQIIDYAIEDYPSKNGIQIGVNIVHFVRTNQGQAR